MVLALTVRLRFPQSQSLKERRKQLRPIVDGVRSRFSLSVAEVGGQDSWQLADLGIAIVSELPGVAEQVADDVERFVWSRGEVEVLSIERNWMELDGS